MSLLPAWNGSWYSPMNGNSESFKGMQEELGVNPANGVVVYYELPKLDKESEITLEIMDANGKQVNKISSKRDANYKRWAGGPPPSQA